MVDAKLRLKAVASVGQRRCHDARIVDQHVQRPAGLDVEARALLHRLEVGQYQRQADDVSSWSLLCQAQNTWIQTTLSRAAG